MFDLKPLDTLYDITPGEELPLTPRLAELYGPLRFPGEPGKAHVITNFVSTLDGVVTLKVPGHEGGGDISGFNKQDRMIMGLLRSAADAVVITSHSLGVEPRSLWTGPSISPDLGDEYGQFRQGLRKPEKLLHVVVTSSGRLDPTARLLSSGEMPVLVLTNDAGKKAASQLGLPGNVKIIDVQKEGDIPPETILKYIQDEVRARLVLVEGGPHLVGDFFGEGTLDELFLTVAPQVAGRSDAMQRLGFVAGRVLAPDQPTWGSLQSLKRGENHLFLRYDFTT